MLAFGHLLDLHPKENLSCPVGEGLGAEDRKRKERSCGGKREEKEMESYVKKRSLSHHLGGSVS